MPGRHARTVAGTPLAIYPSNCSGWWEARRDDKVTTSGGAWPNLTGLSAVLDLSPNGRHWGQASGPLQPGRLMGSSGNGGAGSGGVAIVSDDAAEHLLTTTATLGNVGGGGFAFYAAVRPLHLNGSYGADSTWLTNGRTLICDTNSNFGVTGSGDNGGTIACGVMAGGSARVHKVLCAEGERCLVSMRYSGNVHWKARKNNDAEATISLSPASTIPSFTGTLRLFDGNGANPAGSWELFAWAFFNTAVTDPNDVLIRDYFLKRWPAG